MSCGDKLVNGNTFKENENQSLAVLRPSKETYDIGSLALIVPENLGRVYNFQI